MAVILLQAEQDKQTRRLKGNCLVMNICLLTTTLLMTGCSGICIVDVPTASVICRSDAGTFREAPLYVTQEGLTTLQRSEQNVFVLRKIGFDGKEKSRLHFPLFTTSYRGESYAFSENGLKFAYVNWAHDRPMNLHVGCITNPAINLLPSGVCDNLWATFGYMVVWVNNDTILLYPDAGCQLPGKKAEPICLLHLNDMRLVRLCEVFGSYGPKSLSPSKRYLMASEGVKDTLLYKIYIIDLMDEKKIFELFPSGKEMHPYGAVWSSDNEIIYAVDNRVIAQRVGENTNREVFRLKPHQEVELYAVDENRNLHYQIYDNIKSLTNPQSNWRIFNLDSKEERQLMRKKITGKVLLTPKRDKIVAEVGY